MENRNIYKMDDFLIISSYIMIIPIVFLAWPWLKMVTTYEDLTTFFQDAPALLGQRISAIILYALGTVSSQLVGRIIRFKEKQSLEILDTLEFYKITTIEQLSTQLGMAESKVKSLVKKMSRIPSLGIHIENDNVTIGQIHEKPAVKDYRTFSTTQTTDSQTGFTGGLDNEKPVEGGHEDISFKDAFKKAASDPELTDEQRRDVLKKAAQSFITLKGQPEGRGKKFNVILFIILFITPLWPIALVYAISFAIKQNKVMKERQN